MFTLALSAALVLAAVHVFGGHLRFLDVVPRSRWLSIGGGVSVAYVFVHILPDLAAHQETVARNAEAAGRGLLALLDHHVYLMALAGLLIYYGLERAAKGSRSRRRPDAREHDRPSTGVFAVHLTAYAVYNGLIGYLLVRTGEGDRRGPLSLGLFALAMLLHFLVNDYGLRQHYQRLYHRLGRWTLALAVIAGWGLAAAVELPPGVLALVFSFLAGGIVLNVLKEELPEERESSLWAFLLGALGYAGLLMTLG